MYDLELWAAVVLQAINSSLASEDGFTAGKGEYVYSKGGWSKG